MKLTKNMTEKQFDTGYWYADEIKSFAKEIGISNSSKLRKDELEKLIKQYLKTGEISKPERKNLIRKGLRDDEKGLRVTRRIVNYTSNRATKEFIKKEALKRVPGLTQKSGSKYRLNRWREEQINKGRKITYADLIREYIRLNQTTTPFKKVPVGRYVNFLAEYLSKERNATRGQAVRAWKELKKLDIPKDYPSWERYKKSPNR